MQPRPCAAVIGTVFIDYKGFAGPGFNPAGRNLGRVELVAGGVARNVAVNMAHLDVDTWFVGTLNQDGSGELLKTRLVSMGVHFENATFVAQGGTGAWLALIGHDGELLGSVSQMPDIDLMHKAIMSNLPSVLAKVDAILLEIDLSEDLARAIIDSATAAGRKVYALPGNFSVIGQHYDLFKDIHCFICNKEEASRLFGQPVEGPSDILLSAMQDFAKGHSLKNFVVTLGEAGAAYLDQYGDCGLQKAYPTTVVDSTGAGDSFFSATSAALLHGQSLRDAVDIGAKLASLVIADKNSECSAIDALKNESYREKLLSWVKK